MECTRTVRRFVATILAVLFLLVSIPGIAGTNKGISETEGHRKTGKNPPRKRHAPTDQSDQSVYRVKKGDTLYRIGKQFGVEPAEIRSYNNLSDNDAILPGASLKIPRKSASGVTPPRNSSYRDESVSGTVKNSAYIWPVNGIISVKRDGEEGVRSIGVIITTEGNTVRSTASGIVEKVGRMRGFGNFIVVRHAGGLVSVYSGLDSIRVREGDPVARGCELGSFDKARSDLHFMFHRSGKPEDPLKILPSEKG